MTGREIRILLAARKMTQTELARGVGEWSSTISLLCNDKIRPTDEQADKIKAFLRWPRDDQAEIAFAILAGDGDKPQFY